MLVTLDIPRESQAAFERLCAEARLEIYHRVEEGPAGGNPRVTFLVPDDEALRLVSLFYFGPNGDFS